MTIIATALATLLGAAAVATGGIAGAGDGADSGRLAPSGTAAASGTAPPGTAAPTALVVDATLARDGRELVDPRLEDTRAEVRLPRTEDEARTNVRYFTELGYRVVAAGPDAGEAVADVGEAATVEPTLTQALAAAGR